MWKGRFSQDTNAAVSRFTQSLDLDWRMVEDDIRGSIAHVRMPGKVGLLTPEKSAARRATMGGTAPSEAIKQAAKGIQALVSLDALFTRYKKEFPSLDD